MKIRHLIVPGVMLLTFAAAGASVLVEENFKGRRLGEGWSWIREQPEAWRLTREGLEVRLQPGNNWGPQNSAKNVLVHRVPEAVTSEIQVSVGIENKPTHQYEQADLVWYFNDSNMVKLGQELVDGKLSVVMGREEKDQTRTIAIIPLDSNSVRLRLIVKEGRIRGEFQSSGRTEWQTAGECELPAPPGLKPKISLQFYQGPPNEEHWARVTQFRMETR